MFKNRIDTSGYKEGGVMGGETIDYPGRETVLKHQQELRETARRERSEGLSEGRTEERLIIQSIGKYMREHPHGGVKDGFIGNAPTELCSARIMKDVMELVNKRSGGIELMSDDAPLKREWY